MFQKIEYVPNNTITVFDSCIEPYVFHVHQIAPYSGYTIATILAYQSRNRNVLSNLIKLVGYLENKFYVNWQDLIYLATRGVNKIPAYKNIVNRELNLLDRYLTYIKK